MSVGREPQQSPNWQKYEKLKGRMSDKGFPFREPFPRFIYGGPPGSWNPLKFTVVVWPNAERLIAYVDSSREFMAEGNEWREYSPDGQVIPKHRVVAWVELQPEENSPSQ